MIALLWIVAFLVLAAVLAYFRQSLLVWTSAFFALMLVMTFSKAIAPGAVVATWILFFIVAAILNLLPLRQRLITQYVLKFYRKVMPTMSRTEREALEAGTVGWEGDLFSGKPDWKKFQKYTATILTPEEKAFIDGPVEELCRMSDDWDITHNRTDMPPELWEYIKKNGFFGMIIPKKYGGLEFSALAHATVISKLSGRSVTVGTSVSVPNSLGPGELLLHYGTEEQKNYYLPRLARGEEIPCFALTGPEVGSDASAMPDYGIVCKGEFEGKEVIGIRLNWSKRYITLAPVATVAGLAFKLFDPDHLIGDKDEWGITCALIPTNLPGITIGRRHFPLNCAFLNGPTQGKDVFIPVDYIIGGKEMAGQGWRMLVECLSAGRAISLPSIVVGGAKISTFASGAYARIRRQFGMPIGKFEGIEDVLARMGAFTYMMEATRNFTASVIDKGEKPSVASAISKYHCTEMGRKVADDAMDIHGGKGICLGPSNYIGRSYQEMPIGITVEGANILTRSLIIFGQGAMRCHPFVYKELQAAKNKDPKASLSQFDQALFGHIGHIISNKVRSFWLALTSGRLSHAPETNKRYYQLLNRYSAAFAFVSDIAMLVLGGDLKRREKLSARLGDVLSMMYMISTVLKRYEVDGKHEEDKVLVDWSCRYALFQIQHQLDEFLRNFPNRWIASLLRITIFPIGRNLRAPRDALGHKVASLLISPTESRLRIGKGAYISPANNPVGKMEEALKIIIPAEDLLKRLQKARRDGVVTGITFDQRVKAAVAANILSEAEATQLTVAEAARREVYAVDDFSFDELARVARTSN